MVQMDSNGTNDTKRIKDKIAAKQRRKKSGSETAPAENETRIKFLPNEFHARGKCKMFSQLKTRRVLKPTSVQSLRSIFIEWQCLICRIHVSASECVSRYFASNVDSSDTERAEHTTPHRLLLFLRISQKYQIIIRKREMACAPTNSAVYYYLAYILAANTKYVSLLFINLYVGLGLGAEIYTIQWKRKTTE